MRLIRLLFPALLGLFAAGVLHAQSSTTATILRPYITSISPQVLVTGADSTILTIYGKRFQRGAAVFLNAQKLTSIRLEGDSVLVVVIPKQLLVYPDLATLLVVNPDESKIGFRVAITSEFFVTEPIFSGIQPSTTTATNSAFTIRINGIGFAGNLRVFMGGTELFIVSTNSTMIVAQVPDFLNGGSSVYAVQVAQNGKIIWTNMFVIISSGAFPPAITRITPNILPSNGETIIITGINFSNGVQVHFGSQRLVILNSNFTRITAVVPAGLPSGVYRIIVINPDGQTASQLIWYGPDNVSISSDTTTLYPNPTATALTLETTLDRASTLTLTLRNVMGASVLEERHTAASGRFATTLDVSALASGVYVLEVSDGVGRWAQKVVKY
jgi:hypothetical protein